MSAHDQFAQLLNRIASATSILRTRREDAVRAEAHSMNGADLDDRLRAILPRLEQVAAELEEALAA